MTKLTEGFELFAAGAYALYIVLAGIFGGRVPDATTAAATIADLKAAALSNVGLLSLPQGSKDSQNDYQIAILTSTDLGERKPFMQRIRGPTRPKFSAAVVEVADEVAGRSMHRVVFEGAERGSLGEALELLVAKTAEALLQSLENQNEQEESDVVQYVRSS